MNQSMRAILDLVEVWIRDRKIGSITVNFFKGGITTINLNETRKLQFEKNPQKE